MSVFVLYAEKMPQENKRKTQEAHIFHKEIFLWIYFFPSQLTLILPVNSLQTKTQMTHLLFSFVGWHDFLLQHSPPGKKRNMQLFDEGCDESAAGRRSQAKQWWPVSG